MGSDPGKAILNIVTGGTAGWVDAAKGYTKNQDFFSFAKQGILGMMTAGTSNVQTGGGKYGDETWADTLFPTVVNDWALDDRQNARKAADAAAAAEIAGIDAQKPSLLTPDAGDAIRMRALTSGAGQGRSSTFLTRPSTILGG